MIFFFSVINFHGNIYSFDPIFFWDLIIWHFSEGDFGKIFDKHLCKRGNYESRFVWKKIWIKKCSSNHVGAVLWLPTQEFYRGFGKISLKFKSKSRRMFLFRLILLPTPLKSLYKKIYWSKTFARHFQIESIHKIDNFWLTPQSHSAKKTFHWFLSSPDRHKV